MLRAYRDEREVDLWVMNGGYETLASFGPDVPAEVLRWAEVLPTVHEDARRFYVHAGFRPARVRARTRAGMFGCGSVSRS